MSMQQGWQVMRSMSRDSSVKEQTLAEGTTKRVMSYARPYRGRIAAFLVLVVIDAVLVVATPLILKSLVDDGVVPGDRQVVVRLAVLVAGLALLTAIVALAERWLSSRIGEGLIYDLRTQVFGHVLRQPIAFFTRAQTGALVSRLGQDVIGAQQAFTSVLSNTVSNAISLVLILVAMASLSWQLTLGAVLLVPLFLVPAKLMGRRLADLSHQQMGLNADLSSRMTERFNVAGALLVKLFGRPATEDEEYAARAAGVRDIGVRIAINRAVFFVALTTVASLATAMVYGFGGIQAIEGVLTVGTLFALTALLARLYGPLTAISNVRVDIMTALVSFQRVFEVLDLQPLVAEAPDARHLPSGPVGVELRDVSFSYPSADRVSLASLEGVALGDRLGGGAVLRGIDLTVEPGQLVALVGPSGAGKTTLTGLVARLYDPDAGSVRINGVDLRDATLASISDTVGVVTQEAHLFHDTIRANLAYAAPEATDAQMWAALEAAQVRRLVELLPSGLDTVVGDRGHRLSGGEKQRLAIARLLLKSPGLLVLDEATAHLDSESEVALQRALDEALRDRTAIVIAHRLSTVRGADQILVLADGKIVERGTHLELLERSGLYADLYRTQFATESVRI
ncbi:MAG TPA: ABC transporter ATP-binding protein [Phycicoccus elongatus]|jgi:ATP-binding cassette subfamily B protein|uniref:ABC-type multidrug transport system ATPase and permease component n=1 Tax=Phycicoccus elongatus Lp2 TaxID=1193181 RepID=N0DZ75_9MICO|nr:MULTISPECIES: ABC transporter ATP-binding protein [Phycicoccus]MCB9405606.1 ABC transporter ATP-binding protein [Tetrasphaera sp.]MCO5301652.1 ABC transporter ATP-binding protein/permease [Phycicoccus sp.]CCH68630.1 ABC-type multidrug transport system ATPase and permease component [Phycicoccus elongatus Lp2]HOA65625.1 ABC transporter ATP-binding protein [Phycicoccus elongatus]HPF75563.1 ABC transporter ATP-binding protein [Phycicoccus elongatus]